MLRDPSSLAEISRLPSGTDSALGAPALAYTETDAPVSGAPST